MLSIRSVGGATILHERLKFSGGEIQVRLRREVYRGEKIDIFAHLRSSDDIMELMLVVDALRRSVTSPIDINLICPYLPYARQDRVCEVGESLAIKVMCGIINSLNFVYVEVWDVHSDVSLALIDRVRWFPQEAIVPLGYERELDDCILVAPDAGAIKKTMAAAKISGHQMVRADKIRSVKDGSITGTTVYSEHVGDKNFLVVDDICDGGRTFIELGKVLRPLTNGKLFLYVTHGIFSKGLSPLWDIYDCVYCANVWPGFEDTIADNPTRFKKVWGQ